MSILAVNVLKSSKLKLLVSFKRLTSVSNVSSSSAMQATNISKPYFFNPSQNKTPQIYHRKDKPYDRLMILKLKEKELVSDLPSVESEVVTKGKGKAKKKSKDKYYVNNIFHSENRKHKTAVLKSFILACEETNIKLKTAIKVCSKISPEEVDIEVYEVLFKALARKGQIETIQKFWMQLIDAQHSPSLKCYASIFQCLGNLKEEHDPNELKSMTDQLMRDVTNEHKDFNLNDLLYLAPRTQNDYIDLVNGIKIADPNFEPMPLVYDRPTQIYSQNNLVTELSNVNLKKLSPLLENVSVEDMNRQFSQQLELEKHGFIQIESIIKNKDNDLSQKVADCINILKEQWRVSLKDALERRITINENRFKNHYNTYSEIPIYPFLELLPIDDLVECIILELETAFMVAESFSHPTRVFANILSTNIMEKAHIFNVTNDETLMKKYHQIVQEYLQWFCDPSNSELKAWCPRDAFSKLESKYFEGPLVHKELNKWPGAIKSVIGKQVLTSIIESVNLDFTSNGSFLIGNYEIKMSSVADSLNISVQEDSEIKQHNSTPAFYKLLRHRNNRLNEELKPHPVLSKLFEIHRSSDLTFYAKDVPMTTPPLPWQSTKRGGFYLRQPVFARLPPGEFQAMDPDSIAEKSDEAYPVFDSLNQLGSTPWIMNKTILDLAIEIFTNQSKYVDILSDLSIARHPDMIERPKSEIILSEIRHKINTQGLVSLDLKERESYKTHQAALLEYNKTKAETYSLWCDILYKLSIANHFREQIMYFPHNIDFRGRVYPIAPIFHHMGGDLPRSLLKFAKSRPLGKNGLDWLKIHCINLTELKKKSPIHERLAYANEVMDDILDSANNPVHGKRWWLQAEDPWQTLAACVEIRDALRHPEGPEFFETHLPVHQDGSCNGLQHYSALGRDKLGATYVNVVPGDAPQDIYSEIATLVEEKRAADVVKSKYCSRDKREFFYEPGPA